LNYDRIDGTVILASAIITQIMPIIENPIHLKGLATPDTHIAETYFKEIVEFIDTTPRTGYGSTETFTSAISSVSHLLGFIFDWRRSIFEFIPVENGKLEKNDVRQVDQVEVGKVYRLIFTSLDTELTRYDIMDSVRCVAIGDDSIGSDFPVFKFHSRMEKTISLQNFTRISEEELLRVFKATGIPFVDFTARTEISKGIERLAMYVELRGDMSAEQIESLIHKELYRMDQSYRDLVDFFGYVPVKVYLVPRGTFAEYFRRKNRNDSKSRQNKHARQRV